MTIITPRLVVDTVHAFLTTDSGQKSSLNIALKSYRTQESLSTAQLPDVVTFGKYVYLGSLNASASPYMAIEWDGSDAETENNSREVPHHLSLYLLLLDKDIAGDEEYVAARILDYIGVVQTMFLRGTYAGAKGYTLNNGTGSLAGRILRATIDEALPGTDDELNVANVLIRFGLTVTTIGDYPGT